MEKIIESKQQIPEVRPRIEDTPDPKTLDLEKRMNEFKEGLLKEVLRHTHYCKKGRDNCLICAYVIGQMSINNLNWRDLSEEFPEVVY